MAQQIWNAVSLNITLTKSRLKSLSFSLASRCSICYNDEDTANHISSLVPKPDNYSIGSFKLLALGIESPALLFLFDTLSQQAMTQWVQNTWRLFSSMKYMLWGRQEIQPFLLRILSRSIRSFRSCKIVFASPWRRSPRPFAAISSGQFSLFLESLKLHLTMSFNNTLAPLLFQLP